MRACCFFRLRFLCGPFTPTVCMIKEKICRTGVPSPDASSKLHPPRCLLPGPLEMVSKPRAARSHVCAYLLRAFCCFRNISRLMVFARVGIENACSSALPPCLTIRRADPPHQCSGIETAATRNIHIQVHGYTCPPVVVSSSTPKLHLK